ncbi:MAG TPA: RIP metalloprotease RseP, partial [Psychromonas hadalis]|nr:RIP metalloprotease RseP [Psychromonas hadalis]
WAFDPKKDSIINSLGLLPYQPKIYLQVANLSPDGAAARDGLQVDDELLTVNGVKLSAWSDFVTLIQNNALQTLKVGIERGTIKKIIELTPDSRKNANGMISGFIGVAPVIADYPEEFRVKLQFGPIDAFIKGVEKTISITKLTFNTLVKLITGDVSVKNLSGPISIAKGAGMSADYGIEYFLGFLALISVNLGLMNLMPLPILDGGHLLYYVIEIITKKPVPEKIQEIGFKIGAAILMCLMSIAILNDFNLL